jgi:hypothetical protein
LGSLSGRDRDGIIYVVGGVGAGVVVSGIQRRYDPSASDNP